MSKAFVRKASTFDWKEAWYNKTHLAIGGCHSGLGRGHRGDLTPLFSNGTNFATKAC